MTTIGIAIHNLPEGMTVALVSLADLRLGVPVAIAIAIHNIPAKEKRRLLDICNATGARVVMVPDVLGNLRQFVDDIGRGASRGADRSGDTPLAGASPAGNLDSLLAELDELAQLGDLEALRMRIHDLHNHTRV